MTTRRLETVLIANRGEIACRVIESARKLGYRTVAVCTPPDRKARFTAMADNVLELSENKDYLSIEKILAAAHQCGADAIHPGYGFLSENAGFAQAVTEAGLIFVGPPARAIELMGNKRRSKLKMSQAGVPVIPGFTDSGGETSLEVLEARALELGFPLMIKASAGGGGRGLRRVESPEGLRAQLELARSESESSFDSSELILERALDDARHVEIQVLADQHGRVVHLFERDCSMQRRHQKVVEEAPSPAVSPSLRTEMGKAAVRAAQAVNYVGAGTVEMLLDSSGYFYFMEMNTRLQVEHPVTEMVTGLDLVALQLDIAAGLSLPFTQDELSMNGHAVEVRLYAEDPHESFLPCTGTIRCFEYDEYCRVDHGLSVNQEVTTDYDPMLAKLIAHGRDREEAIRKLTRSLERLRLHGVTTNQSFLVGLLKNPRFLSGSFNTSTLEALLDSFSKPALAEVDWVAAALVLGKGHGWSSGGDFRSIHRLRSREKTISLTLSQDSDFVSAELGGSKLLLQVLALDGDELSVSMWEERNGAWRRIRFRYTRADDRVYLSREAYTFEIERDALDPSSKESDGAIKAPMAGRVISVAVNSGGFVTAGQTLLVIEAMKMQLEVKADREGVCTVQVTPGVQIKARQVVALVETEGASHE